MADPAFVRLPERLLSGNWTDLATGFGVAGLDVKEFPDDPDEIRVVRDALRSQLLEPATRADYDRVQKAHSKVGDLARTFVPAEGALGSPAPWNESGIASVAKKEHKKLVYARFNEEVEEEEPASEPGSYKSMLKPQLQAEVRRRNAERDAEDKLPEDGTKDELVALLEADDNA